MLEYKGYQGAYEPDDGLLFGRIVGTRDVITFVGKTKAEVAQAFRDSVDDYLDFCRERDEAPGIPPSGSREQGWAR